MGRNSSGVNGSRGGGKRYSSMSTSQLRDAINKAYGAKDDNMVEVIKDAAAKKMESVKAQTLKLIDKCSVYYEKFSAIEKQYGSKPVSEVPKGILKEWKSLRDKFDVTDKKRVEKLLEAIDLFEMAPFKIKWDTRMERIGILNLTDNPFKGTVYDRFAHGRIKK